MQERLRGAMVAALVGAITVVGACDDRFVGEGIPVANTCTRQPPLRYENVGNGLVSRHCRSCHGRYQTGPNRAGAPVGIDFDDELDIYRHFDGVFREVAIDQTMPPAGGMLQAERELMTEWLRCDVLPRLSSVDLDQPPADEGLEEE